MLRDDRGEFRAIYWLLWGLAVGGVLYLLMPALSVPETEMNDRLIDFGDEDYRKVNLDNETFIGGASFGDWPDPDKEPIRKFEDRTGNEADVVGLFANWTMPFKYVQPNVTYIAKQGTVPMITWAPHGLTTPQIVDGSATLWQADGEDRTVDEYIDSWARGVCDLATDSDQTIMMRPMHEMNGGWFTWGTSWQAEDGSRPNNHESYQKAWIKIHETFRDECSSEHVRFVWTTNQASVGPNATYMGSYPGDKYVDYVGIDGYNWGGHADWGWNSFDSIFRDAYCAVVSETDTPILIPEWGSVEKGGNKSDWIANAFDAIESGKYSQVQGAIWLDVTKHEAETDSRVKWSVDSSEASRQAYSKGLASVERSGPGPSDNDVCKG